MAMGKRRITTILITLVALFLFGAFAVPLLNQNLGLNLSFDFMGSAVEMVFITVATALIADVIYKKSKR